MQKKNRKKRARKTKSLSDKVLFSAQQLLRKKVINISEWKNAKIRAEDYQKSVIPENRLLELDTVHGLYAYGQNKLSMFVEQIAQLPDLSQLTAAYADAEEEYMPSGPPISPLTKSYFTCWGFFDLCVGAKRETFCSVTTDLCQFIGVDIGLISIFKKMENSRMGFYVHEGNSGERVFLRELITNREIEVIVPSGYSGTQGEIWFTRVMPPPFETSQLDYSVVFITPYVVGELQEKSRFLRGNEKYWLDYFERNLIKTGCGDKIAAYEFMMKYGLDKNYWNEYIFLSYVTHQKGVILLAGFPDAPESLPHSAEGQERLGI
ncbi:MAG: hypothetical protein HN342_15285 [Nitrospina sp.]|nr:hypothetical protein [Nitrospina sp.]